MRYSESTKKHFQTLIGVLTAPRHFSVVSGPDNGQEGDVIHTREPNQDVYEFAHHLTSPYANQLASLIDRRAKGDPDLILSIAVRDNGLVLCNYGFWPNLETYTYDPDFPEVMEQIDRSAFGSGVGFAFPEREMLISFLFSPKKLNPDELIRSYFHKLHYQSMSAQKMNIDGYDISRIHFDRRKMSKTLTGLNNSYLNSYSRVLDLGPETVDFDIVCIGKTTIGNIDYNVYTGAERTLSKQAKRATEPQTQKKPVLAYAKAR